MNDNELTEIRGDIVEIFTEVAESQIDVLIGSEALNSLPKIKILSTFIKGIVKGRNLYQFKMIEHFISTVNSGVATLGDINVHLEKLRSDQEQLIKEVNYILVKIDSWTDIEKSKYFGNIYVAYISKIITWDELTLYTDILDKITLFDINTLKEVYEIHKYTEDNIPLFASMLRLQSLGVVVFHDGYVKQTSKNIISGEIKKERGHITGEGKIFYKLITEHKII